MKRNWLKIFATLALCFCIVLALAACGNKDKGDDKDDDGGTTPCTHCDANDDNKCDSCGESYSDGQDIIHLPSPHDHIAGSPEVENMIAPTCMIKGSYDEVVYCTVSGCGAEISRTHKTLPASHIFEENVCTVCGGKKASVGLKFTSNGDGTCYVSGIGGCSDKDIVIPELSPSCDSVTSIGDYAFEDCVEFTSVIFPDSVTSIGEGAFSYCTSLTSVIFPDSVTSIGEDAFSYCTGLTSVTIPDSVTSIGEDAFSVCTGLTTITVDDENPGYTNIDGNHIYTKDGKTLIQYAIGSGVTSFNIPDSVTRIGRSAFEGCTGLKSVTIPESVTSIGGSAFYDCTALEEIYFNAVAMNDGNFSVFCKAGNNSDGVKLFIGKNVTKIPDCLFYPGAAGPYLAAKIVSVEFEEGSVCESIGAFAFNCTYFISITIPDSVTSIGEHAFAFCAVTSVIIPDSVTSIGNYAFGYCDELENIYYTGSEEQWNNISKDSSWDYLTGLYTITYNYE